MKTILTILLGIAVSFACLAQKRTIDVESFSKLSFGVAGTVYITQGNSEKVEVECDDDVFEKLEFNQRGDKLVIEQESNWGWNSGWRSSELTVYVTMKDIEALSVSGSGNLVGKSTINSQDLRLSVSGSGDIDVAIEAGDVEGRISGSGVITVSGSADQADIGISGSGRLKGEELVVNSIDATISGSGSCYITANEAIEANISGSGSVYYSGDPDRVISNASGSGKIRKN